jgi:hypothetical protein
MHEFEIESFFGRLDRKKKGQPSIPCLLLMAPTLQRATLGALLALVALASGADAQKWAYG